MADTHIIVTGNPVDGLEFYGPFPTANDATEFANTDVHLPEEWWVAPLMEAN